MAVSLTFLVDPAIFLSPELDRSLRDQMREVSRSLVSWLDNNLDRPSKRLRSALVFASAGGATGFHPPHAPDCAAATELLHPSSLAHDDLMDSAETRGDQSMVHTSHRPHAAPLAGDYLVAVGGRLIVGVSAAAAQVWHGAYVAMCEGQALERAGRYQLGTVEEYFATVRGETPALFGAACRLGGLPLEQVRALAECGAAFGIMFRLLDDLMDMLSTAELWAKPVRHDIAQGIYTLPVLIVAAVPGSALPARLQDQQTPAGPTMSFGIVRVTVTAPIDAIYAQAQWACQTLPPSPARDRLATLPPLLGHRSAHRPPPKTHSPEVLIRPSRNECQSRILVTFDVSPRRVSLTLVVSCSVMHGEGS